MGEAPSLQIDTNEEVVQACEVESPPRNTGQDYTSMEDHGEEVGQLLVNQQNNPSEREGWLPDNIAFLLAFIAMSPYVSFICYKMRYAAVPYLALNLLSIPLAFALRDKHGVVRWFTALLTIGIMGTIKTASMIVAFEGQGEGQGDSFAIKCMLYTFTALWDCSNVVYIFGGRALLERYGITSYRRASFAVLCPVQVKYINGTYPRDRLVHRSAHIVCYILAGFVLRILFRYVVQFIEKYVVLEAEAAVILFSCSVNAWNVPPHLYQLVLMRYPVQVIYPYGSIYFSTSSREFWSKWGRPASSFVRYMYYYPLGGSKRAWLSIPIMFLLNASGHYSVSQVLVGDKAEVGWNTVFGILGLAATFEVCGNQCFERMVEVEVEVEVDSHTQQSNRMEVQVPKW
eukprot:CAMPEP_0203682230 /NCGR_PEP_ID=MMETSP0090-20130426/45164_1 /ASSEMBLY_ACC=CAM_ASM_001088 /TAXON_ID=426623 /ORGANISM="Chaetoceros affinis, Strain CCMP159" /LENGTH=399 /DNA_ID=CAMNT_0050551075 /DNA_START=423 /DNA_END=1619 /DNA_ORIENTATION=-